MISMFWTDFNKRLEKHIKDLSKYGFLPEDWRWHQEKIRELDSIDEELINDLVGLHKRHKLSPDLFANLEPLVFELHNNLEAILHGTLTEKTDKERERVNRLIVQIRDLFSQDKIKIINTIKSKIIDISKFGTYFHLCDVKDLPSIWKRGLRDGSVIKLGPIDYPVETRHRGIIRVVDLKELLYCDEDLFGPGNFGQHIGDMVQEEKILRKKVEGAITKEVFDAIYDAYLNYMAFYEQNQSRFYEYESWKKSKQNSRKYLAYLNLLKRKYRTLSGKDIISDSRDCSFLIAAFHRFSTLIMNEREGISNIGHWGMTTPIRWNIGLIINPNYVRNHKGPMPNEFKILEGNPREQILGVYLKDYNKIEMVMYIMFKQTKNTPEERVPIYYSDGSVAWPK